MEYKFKFDSNTENLMQDMLCLPIVDENEKYLTLRETLDLLNEKELAEKQLEHEKERNKLWKKETKRLIDENDKMREILTKAHAERFIDYDLLIDIEKIIKK